MAAFRGAIASERRELMRRRDKM